MTFFLEVLKFFVQFSSKSFKIKYLCTNSEALIQNFKLSTKAIGNLMGFVTFSKFSIFINTGDCALFSFRFHIIEAAEKSWCDEITIIKD